MKAVRFAETFWLYSPEASARHFGAPAIWATAGVAPLDEQLPAPNVAQFVITAKSPKDREALAAELIDRFGPLPRETDHLLKVVAIKGLCRQAGIEKIDIGPKGAVIAFRGESFANPMGLIRHIQRHPMLWKLRPDHKVVVKGEWETPDARLQAAEKILTELAGLAAAA